MGNNQVVGIIPFNYSIAIISGVEDFSYRDRWCYKSLCDAKGALKDWLDNQDSMTEPTGWHRHPESGRRVYEDYCEVRL